VLYAGALIEEAPAATLLRSASHPYTLALLRSVPSLIGPRRHLSGVAGAVPDLRALPTGCAFHPRCEHATERCRTEAPPSWVANGHSVRCHLSQP
jgi:peptide/nickel transport system ATP-binding protein